MKSETLGRGNLNSQAGWKAHFPECTRFKTSAPQRTCLHPHPRPPRPPSSSSAQSPGMVCRLYSNAVPSSECRKMETTDSTELSPSRSLDEQPSSEELGTTSDPLPSLDGRHRSALAAATAAASAAAAATAAASTAKAAALSTQTPAPYSERSLLLEPFSDNLTGAHHTTPRFTHKIGHGRLGFEPVQVSHIARNSYTANDPISSQGPVPGSSSGPVPGSSSGPVPGSSSSPGPGTSSGPGGGSGPGPGGRSGEGTGPGPASDSRHIPGCGHDPGFSSSAPPGFRNPRADLVPNYASWSHDSHWEPQKQPWKFLQVSEPGTRGHWKPSEVEGKSKIPSETLPRGQCLLYNWEEERATNYLDQVPSMQDGSESFFFRHGHQGLLTLWPQSPMSSRTTQKDSYQPPGNHSQPVRGKREAMLEMFLRHQICKEVQAEQEATRKDSEVESVTHHDYRKDLVQAGPPTPTRVRTYPTPLGQLGPDSWEGEQQAQRLREGASSQELFHVSPSQPHDYRTEQPETFWIQRAPQLPGVSNIRTLDTPFRKNCSFSTPVPLSLGQPLPYEPEDYSH
ncbi:sperm-associated antigen 8 isoform X2 [Phacochoerus africanus]|uniref:sperm-associated antigen 8 isoform X2 n=1 Tax=Phacochoerus africanus TaxID=41426 RepID=UPI001FDA4021|nr:sperm-associated antigen 8 isoform X2 [Phacochoerus africanus]